MPNYGLQLWPGNLDDQQSPVRAVAHGGHYGIAGLDGYRVIDETTDVDGREALRVHDADLIALLGGGVIPLQASALLWQTVAPGVVVPAGPPTVLLDWTPVDTTPELWLTVQNDPTSGGLVNVYLDTRQSAAAPNIDTYEWRNVTPGISFTRNWLCNAREIRIRARGLGPVLVNGTLRGARGYA